MSVGPSTLLTPFKIIPYLGHWVNKRWNDGPPCSENWTKAFFMVLMIVHVPLNQICPQHYHLLIAVVFSAPVKLGHQNYNTTTITRGWNGRYGSFCLSLFSMSVSKDVQYSQLDKRFNLWFIYDVGVYEPCETWYDYLHFLREKSSIGMTS